MFLALPPPHHHDHHPHHHDHKGGGAKNICVPEGKADLATVNLVSPDKKKGQGEIKVGEASTCTWWKAPDSSSSGSSGSASSSRTFAWAYGWDIDSKQAYRVNMNLPKKQQTKDWTKDFFFGHDENPQPTDLLYAYWPDGISWEVYKTL